MTQIDDVNEALRMGIKKIDELQQATKDLKKFLQMLNDCLIDNIPVEKNDPIHNVCSTLLTKYKDL